MKAFYQDAQPDALDLVNEAHQTIVRECGLYDSATLELQLVAGVGEYAISPDVFRITSATYMDSGTGYTPLWESSVSELDHTMKTWRNQSPSRPYRYYSQGQKIGFYPVPNQTSLGGFPVVRMNVETLSRLTSMQSPLPPQVPNIDAWVWQVCFRWALRNGDDDQAKKYGALASNALEDLKSFTQSKLVRGKTRVTPVFPVPRNL